MDISHACKNMNAFERERKERVRDFYSWLEFLFFFFF